MKKHIKSYSEINESLGRGSVVFIKGKSEGDKKRLYATYVQGHAQLGSGATMLFLTDDFYRIKKDGDKLKAVKIAFSSEEALKKAVNVKSPGKISVVKNNNKTPWHWISFKHTSLGAALKDIENEVQPDNYLLESTAEFQPTFSDLYEYLVPKVMNTLFFGTNEVMVTNFHISEVVEKELENEEPDTGLSFDLSCSVIDRSEEIQPYLEALDLQEPIDFLIDFETELDLSYEKGEESTWDYPGSPSYWEVDSAHTIIAEIYVNGDSEFDPTGESDSKAMKAANAADSKIKGMIDSDIKNLILNNVKSLDYLEE